MRSQYNHLRAAWVVTLWLSLIVGIIPLSTANSFVTIDLKYRDAADIKRAIEPVLPKGSAISADNNQVILSAPAASIKSVVRAIKALDKPRVQLQVTVFRGKYPDKKNAKVSTTDTGINHQQTVNIEEGQTLVITENRLLKVAVADAAYVSQVPEQANSSANESSAVQLVADNGLLAIIANDTTDAQHLGSLILEGASNTSSGEVLTQQRSQLIDVPTGVHLRITLAGKQRVRVIAKVVTAADRQVNTANGTDLSKIALTNSVETLASFAMNTWSKLSDASQNTHRPTLDSQRKVHSTDTSDDYQQSIWLKVERL
jgi:hypothetical protein